MIDRRNGSRSATVANSPRHIYETVNRYREELENRVKELKDRNWLAPKTGTIGAIQLQSCVLMTAAAYAPAAHPFVKPPEPVVPELS